MPTRSFRPLRWGLLLAALVIAGIFALRPASSSRPEPVQAGPRTASQAALASLERQANELLDGGPRAFKARLATLRGAPVVVNQWASWCDPCRYEFPFFQRLAHEYRGRVGFLGVDSQDSRAAAQRFLKQYPVPYPHYFDPDTSVARTFRGGRAWPTTVFYNRAGVLTFTHAGAYATQAKLAADIRRYALGG